MALKDMITALPVGTELTVTYDSGQMISGRIAGQGDYSQVLAVAHNEQVTFVALDAVTSFTVAGE